MKEFGTSEEQKFFFSSEDLPILPPPEAGKTREKTKLQSTRELLVHYVIGGM